MTAYVIFDVEIRNPERYEDFMRQVKPAFEAAGARYLARGGSHKVRQSLDGCRAGTKRHGWARLTGFKSVAIFSSEYGANYGNHPC